VFELSAFCEQDVRDIADTLEKTLAAVEARKDRFAERDSSPNEFGYRAIHLNLKLSTDRSTLVEYRRFKETTFEVQIRTVIQDAWSVLDHKLQYKGHASPKLKRSINALAAVFEQADEKFLQIKAQVQSEQDEAKRKVSSSQDSQEKSESISAALIDTAIAVENFSVASVDVISLNELLKVKLDGFTGSLGGASTILDDVGVHAATLRLTEIAEAISKGLPRLEDYQAESKNFLRLSPLTKLRHCLYLFDKTKFKDLLFDYQRVNFDRWIDESSE
jgi:putative GTP pyrophosphokinase